MKEFKRLLRPLKKKITVNNLIYRLLQALLIGLAVDLVILIASKIVFIPNKMAICAVVILISAAAGLILALVKYKVTDYAAAEEGDRLGCNERLITAYEILKNGQDRTTMEELAVKDAVHTAKGAKLAEQYKITFPKRLSIITAAVLAASCLTGFAPDAGVYELTPITEQALKEAEEVKKAINNDENLSNAFKEEYNKILKDLNKELKKAKDEKDAKKLINEAQKELKKLEKETSDDKNSIKNMLSDFAAGSDISSAMDMNSTEALSKAMSKLAAELEKMTEEELAELAKQLSELKDELTDEELKELIDEAEKAAEEGDGKKAASALSKAASSAVNKNLSSSSAASRTASSLAKASDGTGKTATSTPNNGNSTDGNSNGNGEGEGAGEGNGEGQGSGEGQNGGNGQGQGDGSGNGSGGTGSGTGGNGRGFGHAEPEKVFTRNAEGMQGEEQQLQSQQTEEGEVTYSETKADGVNGQSVPYDTVVGGYKEQALKETESGSIPYGMKEIIAEYFSGLEK